MKVIYNRLLPVKGFSAMMFFGVILARKGKQPLQDYDINHEEIHKAQSKDCGGYLPYYLKYFGYWLKYGYYNNPFEREAYCFQKNINYLEMRTKNVWKNYEK